MPPNVFDDVPRLLIVPLDTVTPPIVLLVVEALDIVPFERILAFALLSSELDSVHPPIVLDVAAVLEIVPPLN